LRVHPAGLYLSGSRGNAAAHPVRRSAPLAASNTDLAPNAMNSTPTTRVTATRWRSRQACGENQHNVRRQKCRHRRDDLQEGHDRRRQIDLLRDHAVFSIASFFST
jgi:hypothetical protein